MAKFSEHAARFGGVVAAAALLAATGQAGAQEMEPVGDDMLAFADSLELCEPATAEGAHPLMPDFIITHEVTGMESDACAYSQTMPGAMMMYCEFTDAGRQAMAEEIRASVGSGSMSGGTGDQPAWTSECEIEQSDGTRIPMGG